MSLKWVESGVAVVTGVLVAVTVMSIGVSAQRFEGGSYIIDSSGLGASFGGATTGGSYELTSTGGESIIGQGSGGSYKLDSGYVAQLQNSLELTVQPSGLEAYYAMDETSGSFVRDKSANQLDGTTTNSPSWTTGQVDGGLLLNGSTQDARVSDAAELDLTGNFTVSAWIRPGAASQTSLAGVVTKSTGGVDNYQLSYDAAGTRVRFIADCDSQTTLTSTTTLTNTSNWYFIAGVKSGTSMKLYINGTEEASGTCTGAVQTNAANLGIGGMPGSPYFNGRVDEVKLFSQDLSQSEVTVLYDAGTAGNASGLSFPSDIIAGVSQTSEFDAIVLTDSYGYTLSVNQDQNLTSGGNTIPAVGSSIASPAAWSEGTTKGLGFTLFGTNATALAGKWNSGAAYAAFPGSATSIYTRVGQPQGTKDVLNMRLRLDVASTQASGAYTNTITTTGTITP